ncbi:uncharacterized protein KY384_006102 [Bacidia gigantensis]|uniref:uncharacterized protein n=1 Tax=Bacidia gigantensis TaxID=2732470 RepID=UPI001D052D24|nr:uncharacterized protein KY384_006102 [Bacidia gigantensis]KAG8529465.1 hypothetical protein KY384_006102 [Bacidia gigantensis]
MSTVQEARAKLGEHFGVGGSGKPDRWEALWADGSFIPWDRGLPNPALEDLLKDRQDLIGIPKEASDTAGKRKKAFVPGCGKGYDVLLLSSFGYDAVGLEVSETALKRCLEERDKHGDKYAVRDASLGAGKSNFVAGDFFSNEWTGSAGAEQFDLIYDYTFLCALPPSMRHQWALRMSHLLAPDGHLICLEFPLSKNPNLGGPPFGLQSKVYVQHLAQPGLDIPYNAEGYIPEGVTYPDNPAALKRAAHWQPARTHEIGKDQDWISVWHR